MESVYSFYKNQKTQLVQLDKMKDWFIEISKNPKKSNVLIVTGNTGIGKCLHKKTMVLKNDGSKISLDMVRIGDVLFNNKTVQRICYGVSTHYYLISHISISFSYKVTSNHLLCLFNTIYNKIEYISASDFYLIKNKSIYKGINIYKELFDISITNIKKPIEYIGITVNDNIIYLENGILTHNSNIVGSFLKDSAFDTLDIGKLFDIYETNNTYSTKDFVSKLIKQQNVKNFDSKNHKLLLIDSLEEYANIYKTIMRDLIENIEEIKMPVVIVLTNLYFDTLEKKMKIKLNKVASFIHLETPNVSTIHFFIKNILCVEIDENYLSKLVYFSKGDLRNIKNMIEFQKLGDSCFCVNSNFLEILNENHKDLDIEFNNSIKDIKDSNISNSIIKCETEPFIFGMLTYQNYIYNDSIYKDKKYISDNICYADNIEKVMFKYQQWNLLETYIFFSTVYPWKLLEQPKVIYPSNILQKYMNTKKRNKKYDLLF